MKNRLNCGRRPKWVETEEFIEWADHKMLEDKWSPDTVVEKAKDIFPQSIVPCTSTLYNWIDSGIMKTKNIGLLEKIGRKPRESKGKERRNKKVLGPAIEERHESVEHHQEFGHWEIDTVISNKDADEPVLLTLEDFQILNQFLIDQARLVRNDMNMVIDLDSTHSDTFDHRKQTDYNAHYQANGYHPLVAFDELNGDLLKTKLRSGNQYTSNGVKEFFKHLLEHYNQTIPTTDILVRGDSDFATPVVYESCEQYDSHYVIRLKSNNTLYPLAEHFIYYGNNHPWAEKAEYYYSLSYQDDSKPRRVCIRSTREVGELLFKHSFIVTNPSGNISPERLFEIYKKRGTMENYIKETKKQLLF